MFKIITSLTLSLIGLLAKAQTPNEIAPFHGLAVNNNVTVIYTSGADYRIEPQTGPEAAGLITRVQNGTLFITQTRNLPVTVRITAPSLDNIQAAQHAVVIAASAIDVADFSLGLASGARFNGTVKAGHRALLRGKSGAVFNVLLKTDLFQGDFSGGAKVNLSGNAQSGNIATHGNTLCLARNFIVGKASIEATGLSEVMVCANESIRIKACEQAIVRYFGAPSTISVDHDAAVTLSE
jgi:hypothetical protein